MCLKIQKIIITCLLLKVSQSSKIVNSDETKSPVENDDEDGKSSLVFVFDTTGSMYNDLKQLREGAEMILNTALEENGIIGDFVFVPFHDPAVGPATVTRDKEVFKTALDMVQVYGGGDCPEKSLGGIQLALNVSEPRSFIYVFTDATAGDHRLVGKVLDAVQRKQSQVVFVLTGHCNDLQKPSYQVYQQIAAASSGQVFNLNKTSVHMILDFVRSSIKGRMVNLGSSVNPAGYNYSQGIAVDGSVGEVTVSVSGVNPRVSVLNPRGELLTGPPQLVTTIDLAEIMVVKVLQPEPGKWRVSAGSEQQYSVRVSGRSDLTFSHGFSVQPPRTLADTTYRPLEGTYNHMMISVKGSQRPVKIHYAEVLTLSGSTLFELPLKKVDDNLYIADAFIPPDDFFYIAINGRDEHNQELRRIGTTAVQAKVPDVPYLTVPRKVTAHAHSRVVLKCKVESLVPVTAMWTKNNKRIQGQISSLQTTSIEYVIEDMREENVATYRCVARNVAGVSTASTELILLVDPPQVTMEPANVMLERGDNTTVSCTVFSEALLLKFQFLGVTNQSRDVIDVAVEPNMEGVYSYNITVEDASEDDAGNYTCIAANRGGSTNKTSQVHVRSKPIAQIQGAHELSIKQHDIATIYCTVKNSNAISWAVNGTTVKEITVNESYTDFFAVNVTDDGDWTCVAKTGSYEASDTVHISALIKPKTAIQGPRYITVLNGTNHEIVCEVTGKPIPRIVWYRGNEEKFLNHSPSYMGRGHEKTFFEIFDFSREDEEDSLLVTTAHVTGLKRRADEKTYRSVLKLNSTMENVEGTYFCVGENSAGIHEDSVKIDVRRKMKILNGFNDTSVQLYSSIQLSCDVDCHPPAKIRWRHNNTELSPNITLSKDNKTLYISRVNFDLLGSYSCEADNGFETIEVEGTLDVYGLEQPVLFKGPPKRTVKNGESAIFTCRVLKTSPEATISWQYKNQMSNNFTSLDRAVSELTIDHVSANDSGVYRCIADNVMGRDFYDVELVVHYPPRLKIGQQSGQTQKPIEIRSGGNATLSCESVGTPTPIVLWSKDGRLMAYTKYTHLTDVNDLVIDKVTEYDSGLYTCNVTNSMGSVQKNFTLFVYVPPEISPSNSAADQEILEGQLVELPCAARGVPSPAVIWQHNGLLVTDSRKYVDEFGIRFVANLTDFGDYTCVAINQYGNTTLSYSLFIWVPPYIEPPHETSRNVLIGDNATLQCDVVGFPIPTIQWEFNDEALMDNTTDLSFNELGNLYIINATSKHEGAYVCVAENVAGVATKIIHLNLYEPPKILEENYTGPYLATNKDLALTIACKATGKPTPYIVWIKDKFYLDKDVRYDVETDGTLTIKSPTEDMSGNYTCVAKNVLGKVNRTVEVLVYSIPTQMQAEESHPIVTVMEHTNTSIECPTPSSHTDTVKWYKDATLVSTGSLQIPAVTRNHQSTYACVVTNAVGSAYSAIKLNVEWPPTFIDDSNEIEHENDVIENDMIMNNANHTLFNPNKISANKFDEGTTENVDIITGNATDIESFSAKISLQKGPVSIGKIKNTTLNYNAKLVHNTSLNVKKNIESGTKVVEVVKDNDKYLDCRVDAKPIAKTKWYFKSKPIVFEDRERLKILNVQTRNSGIYKCVVGNKHGTIVKEFQLNVLEPPFISEFDILDVLLMEGADATLDCNARGFPEPSLQWTFNNTNWHIVNSSLTTINITSHSEGLFRCDAKNKAGVAHIVYRVSVVTAARVDDVIVFSGEQGTTVVNTLEAVKGSHIRIACNSSGKPTPIVQWLRHGKVLSENQEGISYADLKLDGVQPSQNGAYSCIASNEGGSDERKIKLEVLEPPTIFQTIFKTDKNSGNTINFEVLSGQAYYLHCHANGNPAPEIYWFRDGLPLMFFDDSMFSTDFGEIIQVKRAMQEQSGNYTCVARNKVGNASMIYLVDVLVPPPQPKESSRPISARVGKALTLKCPVQGSPFPNVMWYKQPYTEIGEKTPRVQLTDDNVTLMVNHTQVSDSGNYSCIMTNKVGTTEVIFDVTIEKPPSIAGNVGSDNVESHQVALGKSIVLKCEVDGHPPPKITWLKDTQELSSTLSNVHRTLGDSLVAVWGVRARDAGQYICVAENVAGVVHRRYHLAVIVPGKWSTWGEWSYCNVTCGLGYQQRSRFCQYIDDNNVTVIDKSSKSDKLILDESACKGPADEKRKCHMPLCEESISSWSAWSRWSACSATCGRGAQTRTRRCRARACSGDNVQIRKCPDLPKCEWNLTNSANEVFNNNEDLNENNSYSPEAVFEVQPEIVDSQYSPDVEEFYLDTGFKSPVWYDVKVTHNIDGSSPGPCQPGYRYNARNNTCDDIDECRWEQNSCHATQTCGNTRGGYRCSCARGLGSLGPGLRCMDINECSQGISGCEYACVNVVGGYVCACPAHMRLAEDKHRCYLPGSSNRRAYTYEDVDSEYMSASVEYPAKYKHTRI